MEPDPNVDFIETTYAEWARGEFTTNEVFHPDVEFVTDVPERRTYRGREGVFEGWYDFLSAWRGFTVAAEEVRPVGDGRYLVLVRMTGTGRGSSIHTESRGANLVTMRDGRIARFEIFFDVAEAYTAAGLGPEPE